MASNSSAPASSPFLLRHMRRLFARKSSAGQQQEGEQSGEQQQQQQQQGKHKASRLPFLRKSQSAHEAKAKLRPSGDANGGTTLLAPSRTFDNARSPHSVAGHSVDFVCPATSSALSGCYSEPPLRSQASESADGDLDRSLMQTCTDVKYVNRRPGKFTAVVDANFQRQCLQAHNYVRQLYGAPALLWSQDLAGLAKTWALKLAERGRVLYPELPGIGENIFLLAGKGPGARQSSSTGDHLTTGMELVALWAQEASNVEFARPRWSLDCKHFTQMVWRSALEMGVARHWNMAQDCLAIVAFYRPAGNSNLPGEFAANLPSKGEVPETALQSSSLSALIQALNRTDLGDGGFRKGPLPPTLYTSHSPNATKVLKCDNNSRP